MSVLVVWNFGWFIEFKTWCHTILRFSTVVETSEVRLLSQSRIWLPYSKFLYVPYVFLTVVFLVLPSFSIPGYGHENSRRIGYFCLSVRRRWLRIVVPGHCPRQSPKTLWVIGELGTFGSFYLGVPFSLLFVSLFHFYKSTRLD